MLSSQRMDGIVLSKIGKIEWVGDACIIAKIALAQSKSNKEHVGVDSSLNGDCFPYDVVHM